MIKKSIIESQKTIERKKEAITELQTEIKREQQQIKDYEMALEHLSDAMSAVSGNEPEEVIC